MAVILYIFLYRLAGDFVSNGPDKISIFPKFSTPQFSLYLWMSKKDLFWTELCQNQNIAPKPFVPQDKLIEAISNTSKSIA